MSLKELVYIIIPVYNRKETTLTCLNHLNSSGDLDSYHVVVVDDGSTDGTAEEIACKYPEITVLAGTGDLWWTGAISLGMQYVVERNGEYIVWLNDDCLPDQGTLSSMIHFMQSHPNSIVAPSCYASGSNEMEPLHNGFYSKVRQGCAAYPGQVLRVDGMAGWCVGMPSHVVQKIGLPNIKKFPHYAGDDMYTLAATRSGFEAYLLGDIKATLFGKVHPKLDFRNHFPPGSNPRQSFQSLFLSKKSPYRVQTQFFRHIERYGHTLGVLAFSLKLFIWIGQWLKYQVLFWVNPNFGPA